MLLIPFSLEELNPGAHFVREMSLAIQTFRVIWRPLLITFNRLTSAKDWQ
jgi:hypothetical protein